MEEPRGKIREFILTAFGLMPNYFASVDYMFVEALVKTPDEEFGKLLDEVKAAGWIKSQNGNDVVLTDAAKEFAVKVREALPEIELTDTRMKHLLAKASKANTNGVDNMIPYHITGFEVGYDHREVEKAITLLSKNGYILRDQSNMAKLTDKGKRVGTRIYDEAKAKQTPEGDKLTKRWTDHQTEADKFLVWGWKQHRGDLNKPVDVRRYGIEAKLTQYELGSLLQWLQQHSLTEINEMKNGHANQHCSEYWDVPLNMFFPHAYMVSLTTAGATKAASLVKERKGRWKNGLSLISAGVKEAPAIIGGTAAVAALLLTFGGYLLKEYQLRFQPTPTRQVQPTTQGGVISGVP